jgi:hypothetical protein
MEHPKGAFDTSRAVWRRAAEDTPVAALPAGSDGPDGHIEVAFVDDLIGVRNSADPHGPILVFTESEWDAFVGGAKDGEFDI